MYSRKSEESISGIAAMFFLLTTALSAWLVFMTPYLVRGGFAVGGPTKSPLKATITGGFFLACSTLGRSLKNGSVACCSLVRA